MSVARKPRSNKGKKRGSYKKKESIKKQKTVPKTLKIVEKKITKGVFKNKSLEILDKKGFTTAKSNLDDAWKDYSKNWSLWLKTKDTKLRYVLKEPTWKHIYPVIDREKLQKKDTKPTKKRKDPISSKKIMKPTKSINKQDARYCSCLMKIRGNSMKNNKIRSPYALCTTSVYNKQDTKRTKRVSCTKFYNFDLYDLKPLQAYAIENKIPIRSQSGKAYSKTVLLKKIEAHRKEKYP